MLTRYTHQSESGSHESRMINRVARRTPAHRRTPESALSEGATGKHRGRERMRGGSAPPPHASASEAALLLHNREEALRPEQDLRRQPAG